MLARVGAKVTRRLTDQDRADSHDDGARMHTDSRIWPDHMDPSKRARVTVDDTPLCRCVMGAHADAGQSHGWDPERPGGRARRGQGDGGQDDPG